MVVVTMDSLFKRGLGTIKIVSMDKRIHNLWDRRVPQKIEGEPGVTYFPHETVEDYI